MKYPVGSSRNCSRNLSDIEIYSLLFIFYQTQYHNAESEIDERKEKLKDSDGVQMLKGDEV